MSLPSVGGGRVGVAVGVVVDVATGVTVGVLVLIDVVVGMTGEGVEGGIGTLVAVVASSYYVNV